MGYVMCTGRNKKLKTQCIFSYCNNKWLNIQYKEKTLGKCNGIQNTHTQMIHGLFDRLGVFECYRKYINLTLINSTKASKTETLDLCQR